MAPQRMAAGMAFVAALLNVRSALGAAGRHSAAPSITPELEPKSHKTFFKKDYPDDESPRAGKDYSFDHPYPIVQEDPEYDKDYVKDENNDGGEWKAQMTYDTLRHKIKKAREDADVASKHEKEESEELQRAKEAEKQADADAAEAKKHVEAAKNREEKAEEVVDEIEGGAGEAADGKAAGGDSKIGNAVDKVKKEMSDFEDCKKELKSARDKLEKLIQAKAEAEKKRDAEKQKGEAGKANSTEQEDKAASEAAKKHSTLEEQLEDAEEEHEEAEKSEKELKEQLQKDEDALKAAANKLRASRGEPPVGSKSGAASLGSTTAAMLVIALAHICI